MTSEKGPGLPPPNPPAYQPRSEFVSEEPSMEPRNNVPSTEPEYLDPTTVGPTGQGKAALPSTFGQMEPGYTAPPPAGADFYPPPPGPVVAQPMASPPVVIMQQRIFRQVPVNTICPHCRQNIITSTKADAGALAWLLCFFIAIVGCWLGCCLIPFCIDDCQDITHSCPNCRNILHVYKRM